MRGGVYASGDGTPARQALLRSPKVAFEGGCEVAALITSDVACHADHAEVTLGEGVNDSAVDASGGAKDGLSWRARERHGPTDPLADAWPCPGGAIPARPPTTSAPSKRQDVERIRNGMAGESQAPRGRAVSRRV
jgi:hypothetical protein